MLLAASNEYGWVCRAAAMPGRCHLWQLRVPPGRQRPDDTTSEGHAVLPLRPAVRRSFGCGRTNKTRRIHKYSLRCRLVLCNSVCIIISSVPRAWVRPCTYGSGASATNPNLLLRKNDLDDLLFGRLYRWNFQAANKCNNNQCTSLKWMAMTLMPHAAMSHVQLIYAVCMDGGAAACHLWGSKCLSFPNEHGT